MHQPRLPFRRPDPAPPALTLADLRREGLDLLCRCRLCRHTGILPIAMAIQHHGETATVPAVRVRCAECNGRAVSVQPYRRIAGTQAPDA